MVVHALEGDLQGTDVLETLDGNSFAGGLLLVEVDRLHDAAVDGVHKGGSRNGEDDLENDFERFVHYSCVFIISKRSDKVMNLIYEMQYYL